MEEVKQLMIPSSIEFQTVLPESNLRKRTSEHFLTEHEYNRLLRYYQSLMFEKYQLHNIKREHITISNPY